MATLDFGLEIEFLVPAMNAGRPMDQARVAAAVTAAGVACNAVGYNHHLSRQWKVVSDGSLRPARGQAGFELVSPPLDETGLEQVTKVCEALGALDATVNKSCGLHVHVGAREFPVSVHKKIAELYINYEPVIDSLLPASRRANNNNFCQTMTHVNMSRLASQTTIEQIHSLIGRDRYGKINFSSYWRHGTVEFRHHSGTVQAEKIIKWVVLINALVAAAKKEANSPTAAGLEMAVNMTQTVSGDPRFHPYWRRGGRRRRMLFTMLTRAEGVTRLELMVALRLTTPPLIQRHLIACGAPERTYGRRGGHDVYRLPETVASPYIIPTDAPTGVPLTVTNPNPITLDGFCTRLELTPEDKAYWVARVASFTPTGQDREQLEQARRLSAGVIGVDEARHQLGSYVVDGRLELVRR